MLAQEAQHRIKAEHHTTAPLGERKYAGHEFPLHVEHSLAAEQIAADLQRIGAPLNSAAPVPMEAEERARSSLRKHSLKDELMMGETEGPLDPEDNPYRLAKIRRKSR